MSRKSRDKFHFTSAVFFRWLIFIVLFITAISYLSKNNDPTILGSETNQFLSQVDLNPIISQIYQKIPENSRRQLETIDIRQLPLYGLVEQKVSQLQSQLGDFPNQQIKEIKKELINRLYNDIIKNIENN